MDFNVSEIVFEKKNLIAEFKSASRKANVLFVTFNGAENPENKMLDRDDFIKKTLFAEQWVLSKGYDLVGFKYNVYRWYQDLSADDLKFIILSLKKKYDSIYMYGSSGGGYAAYYFSQYIEGAIPIMLSPYCSLDPELGKPLLVEKFNYSHSREIITSKDRAAFVAYDPTIKLDCSFVSERVKRAFPSAYELKMPYTGHGAGYFLVEQKILKNFLDSIVLNDNEVDNLISYKKLRRNSYVYFYHLLFKLSKRKSKVFFNRLAEHAKTIKLSKEYGKGYKDILMLVERKMEFVGEVLNPIKGVSVRQDQAAFKIFLVVDEIVDIADYQVAFYILVNGNKGIVQWYSSKRTITFNVNELPEGKVTCKVFVKHIRSSNIFTLVENVFFESRK